MIRSSATGMIKHGGIFASILLLANPLVLAADGDSGVAADSALTDATHDQILQSIEETRKTDPELAKVMSEQLHELDSGRLQMKELAGPSTSERDASPQMNQRSSELAYTPGLMGSTTAGSGQSGQEQLPREAKGQREHGINSSETGRGREADQRGENNRRDGNNQQDGNHDNLDDRSGSVLDGIGRGGSSSQNERNNNESAHGMNHERSSMESSSMESSSMESSSMESSSMGREQAEHFSGREGGQTESRGGGGERERTSRDHDSSQRESSEREIPSRESFQRETQQREMPQREAVQRESQQRETEQREMPQREAPQYETLQRESSQREAPQQEGVPH